MTWSSTENRSERGSSGNTGYGRLAIRGGWPGGGDGGADKVPPELSGGVEVPPLALVLADQKSKIIHVLGSKSSAHNRDIGAEETWIDCISSEDRSRGAEGLTK